MATTKTILDFGSAASIDGTNDYLLIEQTTGPIYKKINRSTFLGVAGQPADISSVQTLTSKTLTAPAISAPVLSGTITGTYTLGGTPTFPTSVVTLTGVQTLTSKTLTSPAITGGTISNTTIAVDSIAGFSTSTIVTVGGVQMNNGTIATNNAVVNASVADGAITPAKLQAGSGTGWTWQTFTPTWSNLTPGNGTVNARFTQIGKMVWIYLSFVLGSTSVVGTSPSFTPPVAASTLYTTVGVNSIVGFGTYNAAAVGAIAAPFFNATNAAISLGFFGPSATNNGLVAVSASLPGVWTTNNNINITIFYEAS